MSSYEAVAYRDGKWWTFEIPSLTSPSPRGGEHRIIAMGQSPTAAELPGAIAEVASMWTQTNVMESEVKISYRLPDNIISVIDRAKERDAVGRSALDEAAALRRKAVRALKDAGLNQSDSAAVLGISRQRVQQLLAS